MTNKEAITYIKQHCYGEWCEDEWREAMDAAIKALEQKPCQDAISKQSAIDAMINSRSNADVTLVPSSYTNGWRDGRKLLLDELLQVVFELPSVQPEQSSEIQDILEYLDTVLHPIVSPDHWNVYSELHNMISMLPSVQPEIIECKDCKHRGEKPIADGRYWCGRHNTFMYYCSDAERRTDV